MKTKKFENKLQLNKNTISNLDESMMNGALAGAREITEQGDCWTEALKTYCQLYTIWDC